MSGNWPLNVGVLKLNAVGEILQGFLLLFLEDHIQILVNNLPLIKFLNSFQACIAIRIPLAGED